MASVSAAVLARPPPGDTPQQHQHQRSTSSTLLNSESLRDHLFSSSTPRSRRSSPARDLPAIADSAHHTSATDRLATRPADHDHGHDLDHDHDPSPARAKAGDKRRRRANKLRHRAQSSASASVLEPGSSGAPLAAVMEPPVLSFYGAEPVPLPSRFAHIKRRLAEGHHEALQASWARLLAALAVEMRRIADQGPALIPSIDFARIDDPDAVAPFRAALQTCGVGVVRGVVPARDTAAWVRETRAYLEPSETNGHHDIKPPPPQDPTCFDFFWTPAQVRARAHPNVLRAMRFAMGFWATGEGASDPRMAARFPISYADRIRIHVDAAQAKLVGAAAAPASAAPAPAAPPATPPTIIAQIDGGSLERWEPDGYGRGGTYDSVFRGRWEDYDPWDPAGRVQATPDLYNGAGACSIFRMFQGLLALTDVTPGMVRLLPSPKLATAYFLLRPFFKPKTPAPSQGEDKDKDADKDADKEKDKEKDESAWAAFLAADNWEFEAEPSTIIHGAVPGHAQRVTELWHPHLQLRTSLLTPPSLQAGDYIVWHNDTPYTIASDGIGGPVIEAAPPRSESTGSVRTTRSSSSGGGGGSPGSSGNTGSSSPSSLALGSAPMLVYVPACPLTQTNALYLARQRKAFLRGHPGPDFDATGSGLGSEADHAARLGEKAIEAVGGRAALRAMGLAPWDVEGGGGGAGPAETVEAAEDKMDIEGEGGETTDPSSSDPSSSSATPDPTPALSQAELELVRLANIILFPDQYEFYMPTRHNSPDR